jgi:hypothetical protein
MHISKNKKPTITERITICPWSTVHHKWEIDTNNSFLILGLRQDIKKRKLAKGDYCIMTDKTFQKTSPTLKEYKSVKEITIPSAYIIPKKHSERYRFA